MNRPPALNVFLSLSLGQRELGSVEVPLVVRLARPATFILWLIVFAAQFQAIISGSSVNWLLLGLTTLLSVGVYLQFWYEESERGRQVHRSLERMRGVIYEDQTTGLPNSRHFLFELRRQMMRSIRSGRGFAIVLAEVPNVDANTSRGAEMVASMSRSLQQGLTGGDFVARLQGCTFAAIALDDGQLSAAEKADVVFLAVGAGIPGDLANQLRPVVSVTGYQGETEVRDLLRRAQHDLLGARSSSRLAMGSGSPLRSTRMALG